jgi:hypothetical protein
MHLTVTGKIGRATGRYRVAKEVEIAVERESEE